MKKIVCFGDSLTEGWIDAGSAFHPYTQKLQSLLSQNSNANVINAGISGETICVDMMKRLPGVMHQDGSVDILIIQGGTNDILQKPELEHSIDLYEKFKELISIAVDKGVSKILVLTTMEGFFVESDEASMSQEISDKLRRDFNTKMTNNVTSLSTNTTEICLCDLSSKLPMFSLDEKDVKLYWDDYLHPSPLGYDKMGEIVYEELKSLSWI
ncbi:uncharacterized protein [Clytia hemisphaerica]|uniref:uncharacterized protein n=1 Tax=Clytia hemisphaerica TaxID=252671 RepID=UPI0034D5E436